MEDIKKILQEMGFDSKETDIYLVLIQNPLSTILKISKKTNIDRTTIYDICKRLINKGIVSSVKKNKTNHYKALSPEELLNFFKEKFNSLKNIVPYLNNLKNSNNELLENELFQGKNGIKSVIKDFLKAPCDYKVIGIRKEHEMLLEYFTNQVINRLNELSIKETAIIEKGESFIKLKKGSYRYLNDKISPLATFIYGNTVIFFIWKEPYYAIKIKNKDFANFQESYFDLLWKNSKEIN